MVVDTAVLERIEKISTSEKGFLPLFRGVEQHLAAKEASAWRPDSPEDLIKRLTGAEVLQRMSRLIVETYNYNTRLELLNKTKQVEAVFMRVAMQVLAARGKGNNLGRVEEAAKKVLVEPFHQGWIGQTAVAWMAKEAGCKRTWPTPEQDVREGIDLIIEKNNSGPILLQIKCRWEGKPFVKRENDLGSRFKVIVPAPPDRFYEDPQLGIPTRFASIRFIEDLNRERRAT